MAETLTRMRIRALRSTDWPQVARIYEEGMLTGNATFETSLPSWEEWDAGHLVWPRLVAREEGQVLGWAALAPYSQRSAQPASRTRNSPQLTVGGLVGAETMGP